MAMIGRLGFTAAALAGALALAAQGAAQTLDEIKAAAGKEGKVLWYDSMPRNQGDAILAEFVKAYPMIKQADYLEVGGAQKTARLMQESTAGGPTGDVVLDAGSTAMALNDKGFLLPVDWKALGVEMTPERTPSPYLIAVTAPLFGVLYNTAKIKDDEVPKTYEQMLDPKWTGRIGTWSRSIGLATLAASWGEDKTVDYITKFSALKPKLYRSTYAAAESVGAGEVDLAYIIHHTALPTIEKGAPVKWIFLEPIPLSPLYGTLMKHGRNPNAGKLLLKWLGSTEGALAYERVARRGNPFVPETETSKMLKGKTVAMFGAKDEIEKAAWFNALETRLSRVLSGR